MTYNEIMQTAGKEINPSIYYTINGTTTTIGHDDINSAKIYFNAPILGTIMNGLSVELTTTLPTETPIYFKNIATYETYTQNKIYGPFYVKDTQYNADTRTYSIELYDEFLPTMVDYVPITINYPATIYDFFTQLVSELNFTTDIASLPNGSIEIESDIYDGINYTYRDVLNDIAQATASRFKISNGVISLAPLGNTIITINDDILKSQNISLGEHFGPINTIVLSRSANSDSIPYPYPVPANPKEFRISDNQLMNSNDRDLFIEEIYNTLNGLEYDIYDTELVGYGGFEPLDKVTISTINGETTQTYNSYVFNNEQTFTQGYEETIFTDMPEESVSEYKAMTKTDKLINQATLIVDKVNGSITGLVSSVDDIEETLEGFYQQTNDTTYKVNKQYYKLQNHEYVLFPQYQITEDITYQSGTNYYSFDDDTDIYTLLVAGTDYNIGDNISGEVYNKNYDIGDNITGTLYEFIDSASVTKRLDQAELQITEQGTTLQSKTQKIDDDGNIQSLKVTSYTLDSNGFLIDDGSGFKSLTDTKGQYYYDGDTIIAKYSKDGSVQKDIALLGNYYYGIDGSVQISKDTPFNKDNAMFMAQLYEDGNGETGFGHFYNGS